MEYYKATKINNYMQHEFYTWHWAEAARHTQNILYDSTSIASIEATQSRWSGRCWLLWLERLEGGAVCWLQGGPREPSGVLVVFYFLLCLLVIWVCLYFSACTLYFNKKFTGTTKADSTMVKEFRIMVTFVGGRVSGEGLLGGNVGNVLLLDLIGCYISEFILWKFIKP